MAQQDVSGRQELPLSPSAPGIVEGDDEIPPGRGLQPPCDDRPGRQQVREGDRAKIMAERGADQGGTGRQGRDARHHLDVDTVIRRPPGPQEDLIGQAGHAVDADIPGGDQGHGATRPRLLAGRDTSVDLLGHALADHFLVGEQVRDQIDILGVTDHYVGRGDDLPRPQAHLLRGAGTQPHQKYLALSHLTSSPRRRPWHACRPFPGADTFRGADRPSAHRPPG